MMDFIATPEVTVMLELLVAMILGLLLGGERTLAGKNAGMRTHAFVAMASTLFISVSLLVTNSTMPGIHYDLLHVVSGIITGIGFIGAGTILFRHSALEGLTTAAGLWMTAAIGVAIGFGYYGVAVFATIATLFVFRAVWFLEHKLKMYKEHEDHEMAGSTESQNSY
jgi:putative Mg2+ transporter-C (MgtC) family protein